MPSTNRAVGKLALLVGLVTVVVVPPAAGQDFWANIVSWSPIDVRPGEPVTVVLTLRAMPTPDAAPPDGRRNVHVVIRGKGDTRRFAATPLGSGRYRARLVFPETGEWTLWAQYRVGAGGPARETVLGKGGVCVLPCIEAPLERARATGRRIPVEVAIALVVVATAVLSAAAAFRRRIASRTS